MSAAVVTCGGLCPGLNDVIQNIVFTLEDYGVPPDQIFGIRYGLRGFYDREFKPINLNKKVVQNIHLQGGTMLVSFYTPSGLQHYSNNLLQLHYPRDNLQKQQHGCIQQHFCKLLIKYVNLSC